MTIPGFQELMLPVLKFVAGADEVRTGDVIARIEAAFDLGHEEREQLLPSGKQTVVANRTHWAITYLAKTGLLERTARGRVRITDHGRAVLAEQPTRIDLAYLSRFPELDAFRASRRLGNSAVGETLPQHPAVAQAVEQADATPDELIRASHARIDAALRELLLTRILGLPPAFFERLIVRLLVAMGFGSRVDGAARELGRSGDGGVDGVIDQDALGLDRVYLQAKRYAPGNGVGADAIRDFFGSLNIAKASKGVFITTSTFTRWARDTADRLGARIVLIDGDQLAALMIRHDVGVRIEETFHIKKIDEDFFVE